MSPESPKSPLAGGSSEAVRALVRDIVARHLATTPAPVAAAPTPTIVAGPVVVDARVELVDAGDHAAGSPLGGHPSHVIIQVVGIDIDIYGDVVPGSCVIEPSVPCTHCGYCRSYGD